MLVDYRVRSSVRHRRRVADLKLCFGEFHGGSRIPATERGLRDAAIMLDHLVEFIDGPERIDTFLQDKTLFDAATRARLKQEAFARPFFYYSPEQLGQLLGLTWEARIRLKKIRTIRAVDTPPPEELLVLRNAANAACEQKRRAAERLLPKPPSAAKLKAADQLSRRLTAIHDVIKAGGEVPIKDLCGILKRPRNSPFHNVKTISMPGVVRRIVAQDPSLDTALRPVAGRPDLKKTMWVRLASASDAPSTLPDASANMADALPSSPTTPAEYFERLGVKLAEFTNLSDLQHWYETERALRARCLTADEEAEAMRLLNVRATAIHGRPVRMGWRPGTTTSTP